ncbi:alpha-amylase [Pseudoduganella sp. FT93W]|uniref:Alpha-amylase n=1 Tax=Duganella fentianensis TaxID=2692177 RepID=A0A845I431_9BURK|nr:alpha-amylase family glycosyl hydrolase [Duganella fentianensis]MYN46725.1 alpha-amylase [Duganella fentianensis]
MKKLATLLPLAALLLGPVPAISHAETSTVKHPAWTRSANIYQVNVRQFSKEGTLNAVTAQLPRLKAMGVEAVWLMPIHPLGEKNRKGSLGSHYAVRDYLSVNPDYGTLDDLRKLVKQAHALGMRVMLDWVGNHTSWDNKWASEHPDWFKKNDKGEIYSVTFKNEAGEMEEWTDVIGLDFSNKALWKAMTDAMAYWVRAADIDGYRCDAAGLIPTPFWNQLRTELNKIKPMFLLAEWDQPDLHEHAFDATYDWPLSNMMIKIGKGEANAADLRNFLAKPPKTYGRDAYRLEFTANHDVNSWQGTDKDLYGPAYGAMAVLSYTLPGIPMIYNGQESRLEKRLEFFEKDPIEWKTYELEGFYTGLNQLKKANPALWNGAAGGPLQMLDVGNEQLFAFKREQGKNSVRVIVNLTGNVQKYKLAGDEGPAQLKPWRWRILVSE